MNPATSPALFASVEVLYTPADFGTLPARDLGGAACVVFDILRATTSIVTALANGASAVIPAAEIDEALALRAARPDLLLAGERHGLRIGAAQTGGVEFDFGNSPREFTAERVRGRILVTTTTNGTRALRACAGASAVLVASFLNLEATAQRLLRHPPRQLFVVCSGTFEEAAYEDALAAGALLERLAAQYDLNRAADSALIARQLWRLASPDLPAAIRQARNARKLLGIPELADDVAFSLRQDVLPLVAGVSPQGEIRVLPASE